MALALVRSFVSSLPVFAILTAASTWFTKFVPALVPGIVYSLNGARRPALAVRFVAGAASAIAAAVIWKGTPGGVILGTLLFPAGAWVGDRIRSVVDRPTRAGVLIFVIVFGIAYPALTGAVDLWLRAHVP